MPIRSPDREPQPTEGPFLGPDSGRGPEPSGDRPADPPMQQPAATTASHGSLAGASMAAATNNGSAGNPGASVAGSSVVGVAAIGGTGVAPARAGGRETFAADELAIVLSHFDIGVIESIVEYPRGSRKAPKLLIVSEQGKFLLKRRARGKDDPFKVAFAHALQLYLASKQFPLPHLMGTKRENNSMLQFRNAVYEVFEYIPGQSYPQTLEATFDSGRILGLYHKLLLDFKTDFQPPSGSYHLAPSVETGLRQIPTTLAGTTGETDLAALLNFLLESYRYSADIVEQMGIDTWP